MKTAILILIGVILIVGAIWFNRPIIEINQGGVPLSSGYHNFTTIATTSTVYLIKSGPGLLGSVIVHTLGTGYFTLYDASSTLPAQRTITATSALPVLGIISASQAAGTYIFDDYFVDGLMVDYNGTQGTSTITWR
jgi:hypothetical protein